MKHKYSITWNGLFWNGSGFTAKYSEARIFIKPYYARKVWLSLPGNAQVIANYGEENQSIAYGAPPVIFPTPRDFNAQ